MNKDSFWLSFAGISSFILSHAPVLKLTRHLPTAPCKLLLNINREKSFRLLPIMSFTKHRLRG